MLNELGTRSALFGLVKLLQYVHVFFVRDEFADGYEYMMSACKKKVLNWH